MSNTDPFLTWVNGYPCGAFGAQGRIYMVKKFNREQCEAALKVDGLQKSVEKAVHSRLRKLAKDGEYESIEQAVDLIESQQTRIAELEHREIELYTTINRLRNTWQSCGGCSDHNCCFLKPVGMGTNGGCRCYRNSSKMQILAQKMAMVFRATPRQNLAENDAEVVSKFVCRLVELGAVESIENEATGDSYLCVSGILRFANEYTQRIKDGE